MGKSCFGMARPVTAGEVRQGQSGPGTSWRVKARFDVAGMARLGRVRHGKAEFGMAGMVRSGALGQCVVC